jgi:hypothetical protein
VSDVRVDRGRRAITAVVHNPYTSTLNTLDVDPEAVVYDAAGKIIAGDSSIASFQPEQIRAGQRATLALSFPAGVAPRRIAIGTDFDRVSAGLSGGFPSSRSTRRSTP